MTDPAELRRMIEDHRQKTADQLKLLEDKLRERIHSIGNHVSRVEGQLTEVSATMKERHRAQEEQLRQTRTDIVALDSKIDGMRESFNARLDGVKESLGNKLNELSVSVGKIDIKTVGLIGGIVILVNVVGPELQLG